MADATIPVDFRNLGQVWACMGLLEAVHILGGPAQGGFAWDTGAQQGRFTVQAPALPQHPVATVIAFLAEAQVRMVAPHGFRGEGKTDKQRRKQEEQLRQYADRVSTFLGGSPRFLQLPVWLIQAGHTLSFSHWADDTRSYNGKLYAGNRSGFDIMIAMVQKVAHLWRKQPDALIAQPFDMIPAGGRFGFDARGMWTALDVGYSPDAQNYQVFYSPVVEVLAALGLSFARPAYYRHKNRPDTLRYGIWHGLLPPLLARAAAGGAPVGVPIRHFCAPLAHSGKNTVISFAYEEVE